MTMVGNQFNEIVNYVSTGLKQGWLTANKQYYGYQSTQEMQNDWLDWVRSGSVASVIANQPGGT